MIDLPLAHVGGIPIEETLGSFGPALLLIARSGFRTPQKLIHHHQRR